MQFKDINIAYGEEVLYNDFSIRIEEAKINCIMGLSGVGKTTLLNAIKNQLMNDKRKISYIFQEHRLIKWKNLYKNIEIVLEGKSIEEKKVAVEEALKLVGLWEYKEYYPNELSGGMKQRGNIARAIAVESDVILMDEPFKAIDIKLKNQLIAQIKESIKSKGQTAIFISHDVEEVIEFGDNISILKEKPVIIYKKFENIEGLTKKDIIEYLV